jgi:hypothetical protein
VLLKASPSADCAPERDTASVDFPLMLGKIVVEPPAGVTDGVQIADDDQLAVLAVPDQATAAGTNIRLATAGLPASLLVE